MHLDPCFAGFSSSFCCCGFINWSLCLCYWFFFPCMWKLVQNSRFKDISLFFLMDWSFRFLIFRVAIFCSYIALFILLMSHIWYSIIISLLMPKKLLVNFRVDVLWESFVFTCYFELLSLHVWLSALVIQHPPLTNWKRNQGWNWDTPSPKWDKQRHLQTSSLSFNNKEPLKGLDRRRGSKLLTGTVYQLVEPFWSLLCYSNTNTGFATI